MSKNNKPVEASSVHSYSLKVDGPTNLKGVKATTVDETDPLYPVYDVGLSKPLPLPLFPPGNIIQSSSFTITTPTMKTRFVWNSGFLMLNNSNVHGHSGNHLKLQPLFDWGFSQFLIVFQFVGYITSTSVTERSVQMVLQDRTTGTQTISSFPPMRVPASQTSHITHTFPTVVITEATANQDPNKEWEMWLTTTGLGGGETLTFSVSQLLLYIGYAEY